MRAGEGKIESDAHLAKIPKKVVVCVDNHKGAKAKAEEEFHEVLSNGAGQGVGNRGHINQPSKLIRADQDGGIGKG